MDKIFNNREVNAFLKKAHDIWVETPQMLDLLESLENLLLEPGGRLYLRGASFTGKSSTVYDFLKSEDAISCRKSGYGYKNGILYVLSSIEADLYSLYCVILASIRDEALWGKEWSADELRSELFRELETRGLRLIIIDDINYLATSKREDIKRVIGEVLDIAGHFNASVMLIDLDEDNYQSPFPGILEGFTTFTLNRLDKEQTSKILTRFEREYDMQPMRELDKVLESVYKASEGRVGRIDRILRDAGADAVSNGVAELSNDLIHENSSFWYHWRDVENCNFCGYRPFMPMEK